MGSRIAAIGGVLWDGNWILGYNHYLGECSIFYVELWDILDELVFLQIQGYNRVVTQSNSTFGSLYWIRGVMEKLCNSKST
ncbi:hypothetical protein Golob_014957, partial [Gossypium lobatum]|nr:hypothetical protein [Gossypium lobatum]